MAVGKRLSTMRSFTVGILVALFAAMLAKTNTRSFPCEDYLLNATDQVDPRMMGCLFREHIENKTDASVSQEGRMQRDSDTFFWSLFGNAFAVSTQINKQTNKQTLEFDHHPTYYSIRPGWRVAIDCFAKILTHAFALFS